MKKIAIALTIIVAVGVGGYVVYSTSARNSASTSEKFEDTVNQETVSTATQDIRNANNYRDFNQGEYEKAKSEGKTVMLYFTANWCPTCKAQEPVNVEVFKELESNDNVVIFKVHILDSETTEIGEDLADEFGVRLQHTYVLLGPEGEETFRHTGPLTKKDLLEQF